MSAFNWLVELALLFVPAMWRGDVRRDLAEESASAFWRMRQAVTIGMQMRLSARRSAAALPQSSHLSPWRDLRFAARMLMRQPGWTAVAVLTLAIGIGANAAVFGVVNATLLNPLPYPNADRIVMPFLAAKGFSLSTPGGVADVWRRQAKSLDAIESYRSHDVVWTGAGDPRSLRAVDISDTFPAFAGMHFIVGRGFAKDETATLASVAVLSEQLWRTRFAANRGVIGQTMTIQSKTHTIIGVAADPVRFPAQFHMREQLDVFLPMPTGRPDTNGSVMARLSPGATTADAEKELQKILVDGDQMPKFGNMTFSVRLGRAGDVVQSRQSLVMISWAVALVLVIACVNVAHLLLARGFTRERELAIRSALGAGRWHIARQLMTECLLITIAGAAAGLALGSWMLRAITAARPVSFDVVTTATMNWTVVAATVGASIVMGIAFGALCAWRAGRGAAAETLRATSLSASENRAQRRVRSLLVVAEVAVAAVLLVGSGMLLRSVINLQSIDLGFNTNSLYAVSVPLPPERCTQQHGSAEGTVAYCQSIANDWLDRMRAVPGIEQATLAGTAPPHMAGFTFAPWERRDLGLASGAEDVTATNSVRDDYFRLMGLKLLDGPGFDEGSATRREAVLNKRLAEKLWPGERAIGKQLRSSAKESATADNPWLTVVGITGDPAVQDILNRQNDLTIYTASRFGGYSLIFRAAPGADITAAVRGISLAVNANLALPTITNIARAFDDASIAAPRFMTMLLAGFAAAAMLLCSVGLYGVIAHLVSQRTREIGIRLALGGTRTHIGRLVLGRAIGLTIIGLVVGLFASRWAASIVSSSLYGVSAFDPMSYGAGAVVLLLVTAAACIAPIVRAMRVDPLTATRAE